MSPFASGRCLMMNGLLAGGSRKMAESGLPPFARRLGGERGWGWGAREKGYLALLASKQFERIFLRNRPAQLLQLYVTRCHWTGLGLRRSKGHLEGRPRVPKGSGKRPKPFTRKVHIKCNWGDKLLWGNPGFRAGEVAAPRSILAHRCEGCRYSNGLPNLQARAL